MINLFSSIVDIFKGKERADWVVQTWLRDHAEEYKNFVAGIDKMAEGDMTTAFEMYRMMKECMPPWRKRSMPTHSERFNPPTFRVKIGLKSA